MPVIRIDDATWERLKHWAVPLEDSPTDAVRKILDVADEHLKCARQAQPSRTQTRRNGANSGQRLPRGRKVPNEAYSRPILEALVELGGRGRMTEVLDIVESKVKDLFSDVDKQPLSSGGDIRWRNTAQWARYQLVRRGLLKADSERGVWELTPEGINFAESHRTR